MEPRLTPDNVLRGYGLGIFPTADPDGQLYWCAPDPRCIFEFTRFHVPRSLRPVIRQGKFQIRINTAFDAVMRACADRPEGTWILPEFIDVYTELHRRGYAHSLEAWYAGQLAGGLYGVALGGAFFGESMFHRVRDASKVALAALIQRLQDRGFMLVDAQWSTPHLERFGAIEIPRAEFLRRLDQALEYSCPFAD